MLKSQTTLKKEDADEETSIRVAIQGYQGAFHEIAARHCFQNEKIEIVPAHTFEELIQLIEKGETADAGLMAIENTLAGSIMPNYNLLNETPLSIVGEVYLRIKQNLMVWPGVQIEELTEVHSHYMAIAQCRTFFRDYPHIKLIETADTALSARDIRNNQLRNVGAIASTLAAEIYELEVIAPGIETNKKNHTRFLVLTSPEKAQVDPHANKVSLSFSVNHEVGSLYKVLAVLAAYDVNLTKIQSTPIIGQPWQYRFYIDFVKNGPFSYSQAIEAIKPLTDQLNIMGIYEKGEHFEY